MKTKKKRERVQKQLLLHGLEMSVKTKKKRKRGILPGWSELGVFHKAGKAVFSTLKLDEVLQLISEEAVDIMKVDVCSLRLLDEEKQKLILRATCGHTEEYKRKKTVVSAKNSVTGKAVVKMRPVVVRNVQKDSRYRYPSLARKEHLISLLAVPLIREGDIIGVIDVCTRKAHTFTGREIKLLSMFADQAAIAIENARLFEQIQRSYLNTIKTLGAIIDARDSYTRGHSEAVMKYATEIAREMNLPDSEIELIRYAGFLHDIGKVGVDMNILSKSGPLTQLEWKAIVKHPVVGSDIVRQLGFLDELVPVILHHHERYDGEGYPDGLKKEDIPLPARILGVADAFDAMILQRPYRSRPFSRAKAIDQLKKNSGVQFDPEVVSAFLRILEGKKK